MHNDNDADTVRDIQPTESGGHMTVEQNRAEFEAWYEKQMGEAPRIAEDMYTPFATACWEAYQAGRAALQSQDREDAFIDGVLLGLQVITGSGNAGNAERRLSM